MHYEKNDEISDQNKCLQDGFGSICWLFRGFVMNHVNDSLSESVCQNRNTKYKKVNEKGQGEVLSRVRVLHLDNVWRKPVKSTLPCRVLLSS